MTWDVWIHACSHELLGSGYGFEGFHGCIAMVFFVERYMVMDTFGGWIFPSMRVSQGISCVTILWVCCLFSYMWILIPFLFQIYYWLCGNGYIPCCQVSLQVVSELWFYYCNPRLNPWECMRR